MLPFFKCATVLCVLIICCSNVMMQSQMRKKSRKAMKSTMKMLRMRIKQPRERRMTTDVELCELIC